MPPRRALTWALTIAMLAPAGLAVPTAGAATASELAQARERIDRTSAELAQARTRADRLGGPEREALERIERRLQAQKDALLALESGLAARHAAEAAAEDGAADAEDALTPSPGEASDGPLVVLPERPARAAATATPAAAGQRAQESVPAVTGSDAELTSGIDGYLASKASPLTGLGAVFVTESRAVGLDPRFLVAISGAETSFGTYGPSQGIHNPFGMGPHIVYASWSEAIGAAARNLGGSLYLGDGRVTIGAIQQRWAPNGASNDPTDLNSNWARNVSTYYTELGGDPLGAVFTRGSAVAATIAATGVAQQAAVVPNPYGLPVVAPVAAPVIGSSGLGPDAAQEALSVLGAGWAEDGDDRASGFDDAGLVRWSYARHDIDLPSGRAAMAKAGKAIAPEDLDAGDAVFFSDESGRIVHVGLYVGAGQFVHAPGEGSVVRLSSLYDPVHATAYAGARRY
ncbi:MAG: C40 family peptidase [Thermoleophilia bacterium]|nr:C40 family peptidase [Thermoleophilia bacterium]